ncbi:MFS transporter, DHA1 family, putative efflux transporter [Paenibacillus polysaccharolyticus]|uniref:MFS transporter, DHA1 family, putative efflux transporter n=1 Tax=Paenibacillus polysaccharolyticus TaxID=582692 RepID=A0A1G5CUN1_9BACL|nr:MFS transporter [Paenibacillus polysaccharolyticus]SCY05961.1 MFS transporter, DHA1 family, putative efflux transporter [Paenibacillus polysaccharolyticus]
MKSSHSKVYILAIVSFLVGTSEYALSGILDKVAASFDVSLAAAGQLITIFSLIYALCTPILMALTASMDRRKLMMISMGIFIVSNILAFVLPGYGLFAAARVMMAIGAGIVVVTALNIAAKIAPSGKQASAIATVVMGFTASLIIGVPLGRIAADTLGWKSMFGGIAILGILAIIILSFVIPRIEGDAPVPLKQQLSLLKKPKVALGLAITFFWLGGYSIAYTYLSPYLLQVSALNNQYLSGALLVFGIASMIGSKLGGFSADRWGVNRTLFGGFALHILMLILLSVVTHTLVGVMIVLLLWSFSAWSSGPTQQYHLTTIEPEASGVMLSLNQSMMQLAMAAGAGMGGIAIETFSLSSITWIGAGGIAIAIIALIILNKVNVATKVNVNR